VVMPLDLAFRWKSDGKKVTGWWWVLKRGLSMHMLSFNTPQQSVHIA
jgi:hypothetical protein